MLAHSRTQRIRRTAGFTLLEVLIAIAILAISLMILVSAQSSAARMTADADRILIGTMLAKQKLAELELTLEAEDGFSEQDEIDDEGDFDQVFDGQYQEYKWSSTIRKVDLSAAGGLASMLGQDDATTPLPGMPDQENAADSLDNLGLDQFTDQLAKYIREVKVTVYWGDAEDADSVTMVTHVIKPSGT